MRDFNHTVKVLVQAFLKDELTHCYCTACAVGNIVKDSCSGKVSTEMNIITGWPRVFFTGDQTKTQRLKPHEYQGLAKEQIESTGYDWRELARIEFAFESADEGNNTDEHMFNGLMAVIDVLAEIHGIDLTAKEEAKKLFVKI